ncbi:hypothetical protein DICVIV_01895 [Dictyocaulus viviparus]|uniref:Uncharacterized protein n=1 Tax=Dictyocaulus viviparus TaxID=29172 RepID=A0A0D8Y7G4_DICVI|nr:hypothetical protein DICVIV_01895 [Dictyocaulus viviparus]
MTECKDVISCDSISKKTDSPIEQKQWFHGMLPREDIDRKFCNHFGPYLADRVGVQIFKMGAHELCQSSFNDRIVICTSLAAQSKIEPFLNQMLNGMKSGLRTKTS